MEEDRLERREEELRVDTTVREVGAVRLRKSVQSETVEELVPRELEEADVEREPAREGDSGETETLPDGSISIPLLEEELVVSKRVVVRERIVIRKRTVTEREPIRAELRKERVELETEGDVQVE